MTLTPRIDPPDDEGPACCDYCRQADRDVRWYGSHLAHGDCAYDYLSDRALELRGTSHVAAYRTELAELRAFAERYPDVCTCLSCARSLAQGSDVELVTACCDACATRVETAPDPTELADEVLG